MIPLRTARLVVVFGGNATEMAHLLREDAIGGGLRPVMVLDGGSVEGSRYADLLRRIALDMDGLIIVDAGYTDAYHVKAMLPAADFALATTKGSRNALQIFRDGDAVWIGLPARKEPPRRQSSMVEA
jgi:hypothetical protein